jgi:xylulokinase
LADTRAASCRPLWRRAAETNVISEGLFLGVDLGTSSLKCGLFDAAGRSIGSARVDYPTLAWAGGAEQDADSWWQALLQAVRIATRDVSPQRIAALALGGHAPAPVFVDAQLSPVAPVLLWSDHRCAPYLESLPVAAGDQQAVGARRLMLRIAARAMWLRDTRPDQFERARHMLHGSDYLVAQLTGQLVMTGAGPPDVFAAAGLPADLLPATQLESGQVAGRLTPEAAARLGLNAGTAVVSGGLDSFLAAVGSGICLPGEACIGTGSSSIVAVLSAHDQAARFRLGGHPLVSRPVRLGGLTLTWARQCLDAGLSTGDALSRATALPAPVIDQPLLDALLHAMQADDCAGCDAFAELARQLNQAQLVRLVLDTILLRQKQVLDELAEQSARVTRIRSVGGLAAYSQALQLQADVLGADIEVPRTHDSGTLGAALLAALALGLYDDHNTAVARMVAVRSVYRPRAEVAECYAALSRDIHFPATL